MHGYLLAVSASMCWGVADFLGGLKARSVPVLRVLGLSQPAGLALLTAVTIGTGSPLPGGMHALLAVAAGALGIAALGLFYAASTKGSLVMVAPLSSAVGAIIPVLAGLARGEALTAAAAAGIGLVLAGTPAAAWHPGGQARHGHALQAALLAAGAGTAAGLWFTIMDLASAGNPLGAAEVMQLTATAVAAALFAGHLRGRSRRERPQPGAPECDAPGHGRPAHESPAHERPAHETPEHEWSGAGRGRPDPPGARQLLPAASPGQHPATATLPVRVPTPVRAAHPGPGRLLSWRTAAGLAIAAIGVTDALAEICYTSAATAGQLSIISPLSSLYPVITVILAAAVLRERVHPVQGLGALCALAGALLLAL